MKVRLAHILLFAYNSVRIKYARSKGTRSPEYLLGEHLLWRFSSSAARTNKGGMHMKAHAKPCTSSPIR